MENAILSLLDPGYIINMHLKIMCSTNGGYRSGY